MKRISLVLLAAVLIFIAIFHRNNNPNTAISVLNKHVGLETGKLRYRVYLLGLLPVGTAVFEPEKEEVYNGAPAYHLRVTAVTLDFVSKMFKASAEFDSYLDRFKFNPVLFKQKLSLSGKPDTLKEVYYDQEKGVISISGVGRQILPDTQDPLSAIFNIRRMDLTSASELELNLNTNQKNYIMQGAVKPGKIFSHKKIYRTAVFQADIQRRDKNPYHKSHITMVVLTDYRNTPVLIKVFSGGVLITARLIEGK